MWHTWKLEARLFHAMREIDELVAAAVRAKGCGHCGGPLHRADYRRKPRGLPVDAESAFAMRYSACCAREGCRKRASPPSIRFAGRKVYVGFVVVIAPILKVLHALARAAAQEMRTIPRRTVRRWQSCWRAFSLSSAWRGARAFFRSAIDERALPASLLERFGEAGEDASLLRMLAFVTPHVTALEARIVRVT